MNDPRIPVTEDELHAYVDDELPAERRGDVETWLSAHPDDAERVRSWREMAEALKGNRTETGPELAGTAAYLAPEQAKDASVVDHRADVYSLGVTLYEALTGRLPFEGRNRVQVIFQHLSTPPVPPAQRAPGIPPLASDLCLWMLSKAPEDRPQNYEELRQAFDTVMGVRR